MSDSSKAVFLSYASQDKEAAKKICDALRATGLEVWFDVSELRGGDAWDAKIRKQIKECALFVPIISAATNSRPEGYFRLEWKLAVDRSHLLADDHPFLFPIAIGDVSDATARVPDKFREVQWTRLRLDETPAEVAKRVTKLLQGGLAEANEAETQEPRKKGKKDDRPKWLKHAWSIVGLFFAVYYLLFNPIMKRLSPKPEKPEKPLIEVKAGKDDKDDEDMEDAKKALETVQQIVAGATKGVPEVPAAPSETKPISDKSVAVLPFSNMSEEKDSSFFADGIHEDVLTNLALVKQLKVVSRTSVMQYRDTTKTVKQIAQELGVAYILEGSVRRSGNKVRVTGQLIKADTDEHVWAKAYDRDLTDLFTIQSQLAQEIASALSAALSPQEKSLLDRRPTDNLEAYDAYVKARALANGSQVQQGEYDAAAKLLQKAVELDPNFAEAWAELGRAHAFAYFNDLDHSAERLDKARVAIEKAVSLAPDSPDVIEKYGDYFYYGFRDYERAVEQYQRLAVLRPNDASVFGSMGLIHRRQGRWKESLAEFRRALEIDPRNQRYIRALQQLLGAGNHYDEAIALQQKLVDLNPQDPIEKWNLELMHYAATGSGREVREWMAQASLRTRDPALFHYAQKLTALALGDLDEAIRLDKEQHYYDSPLFPRWSQDLNMAFAYYVKGDKEHAMELGKAARLVIEAELARKPSATFYSALSGIQAFNGQKEEALASAKRAMDMVPESNDAVVGPGLAANYAGIRAWFGDKDYALAEFRRLLRTPYGENIYSARHSGNWVTLWDDPRFQALVNDPKNNAPLF